MEPFVPSSGTAFVPKKSFTPSVPAKKNRVGLLLILSLITFFASILFYVGEYAYKISLVREQDSLRASIDIAKSKFDPGTLEELSKTDGKISSIKDILSHHTSLVPLFSTLEASTLQAVRFRSFSYTLPDGQAPTVHLTGDANGYAAIALQSDSFNKTGKIKNIVFADLRLDEKGRVLFSMNATVDPSLLALSSSVANASRPAAELLASSTPQQ